MRKLLFFLFIISTMLNQISARNTKSPIFTDEDEMYVLSSFSPDGDGVNDFFALETITDFPNNAVKVFNKEGLMVFNKEYYRNDWNGYYEGSLLPEGIYFYILDDGKGKIVSGSVQLMKH